MTALAWVTAVASFAAYAVALTVGPSCASDVGPFSAAAFFASFLWLAYRYEKRGM